MAFKRFKMTLTVFFLSFKKTIAITFKKLIINTINPNKYVPALKKDRADMAKRKIANILEKRLNRSCCIVLKEWFSLPILGLLSILIYIFNFN
jgi:hypothetical protein